MKRIAQARQFLEIFFRIQIAAAQQSLAVELSFFGKVNSAGILVELEIPPLDKPASNRGDGKKLVLISDPRAGIVSGNHERDSCFVNKNRVRLVDDGNAQGPVNDTVRRRAQAVAQEIESRLFGRYVGDVCTV